MVINSRINNSYFARDGLILPLPGAIDYIKELEGFDAFIGYESIGFTLASTIALIAEKPMGLLRKTRKTYGMERILEASVDLRGKRVALLHAEPISDEARAEISSYQITNLELFPAHELGDWPAALALNSLPPSQYEPLPVFRQEREAGFTLSSGVSSPIYYDVFMGLLNPEISKSFLDATGVDLDQFDSIIGIAKGAIPFALTLALLGGKRPIVVDHGKVEKKPINLSIQLGRVLLVDETVGSGESFRFASAKLQGISQSINFMVAAKFQYGPDYEFPVACGVTL